MSRFPLLENAERTEVADTSRLAFDRIRVTLADREYAVLSGIYRYLASTGHSDVTGAELAEHAGLSILSVRPRLTGLVKKGVLLSLAARPSRVATEGKCHPVRPTLPQSAIERAEKIRKQAA